MIAFNWLVIMIGHVLKFKWLFNKVLFKTHEVYEHLMNI
jgi:hypothetical protein